MSKKVKLADVLWKAANVHLVEFRFSCHAVAREALGQLWKVRGWEGHQSLAYLRELGCPDHASSCEDWHWMYEEHMFEGHLRDARYMWLLLAMHVAEDEDIEIEVSDE